MSNSMVTCGPWFLTDERNYPHSGEFWQNAIYIYIYVYYIYYAPFSDVRLNDFVNFYHRTFKPTIFVMNCSALFVTSILHPVDTLPRKWSVFPYFAYTAADILHCQYTTADTLQRQYTTADTLQRQYTTADTLHRQYTTADKLHRQFSIGGTLSVHYCWYVTPPVHYCWYATPPVHYCW
jgi:hypothetical protein